MLYNDRELQQVHAMGMKGIPTDIANPAKRLLNLCDLVVVTNKNVNAHIGRFMAGPFEEQPNSSRIAVLLNAVIETIDESEMLLTRIMGEKLVSTVTSWCAPMRGVLSPLTQCKTSEFKAVYDKHRKEIDISAAFIEKALLESNLPVYEGSREDWNAEVETLLEEIRSWKQSISELQISHIAKSAIFDALTKLEQSLADSWITGPQGLKDAYIYAKGVNDEYGDELGKETSGKLKTFLVKFNTVCDAAKNLYFLAKNTFLLLPGLD